MDSPYAVSLPPYPYGPGLKFLSALTSSFFVVQREERSALFPDSIPTKPQEIFFLRRAITHPYTYFKPGILTRVSVFHLMRLLEYLGMNSGHHNCPDDTKSERWRPKSPKHTIARRNDRINAIPFSSCDYLLSQ